VFSHILYSSVDPWWNPAHLTLYAAVAVTLFGVWRGLRAHSYQPPALSPIRFVNLAGLRLTGLGCLIEITAGVWNEIVHHIIGSEPRIAPAHALLTVGMLTVNLGVVIGLTIEYGMIRREFIIASARRRATVALFVLLAFSAIWLAASGGLIYLAGVFRSSSLSWPIAFFLALFATFVLVPLKRVMPSIGSAVGVSVTFNTVAYVLLVFYAGSKAYVPWGILPVVLFELVLNPLKSRLEFRHAVLFSSGLIGLFFGIVYYPFTVYLFPWSFSLQPLILSPIVGSVIGALFGNGIYARLSSLVLGDVNASL